MLALDQNPRVTKIAPACRHAEAVATAFPCATDAGLEILSAGGNAIDAAVAAAWALCACEPSACGIGGQTVLLVHRADGQATVIDGHSSAPKAASLQTISRGEQQRGYRSCTVPTTPATLDWAQARYGSLDRRRVLEPAIRIAADGYAITKLQNRQARWVAEQLRASSAAELFLHEGCPPPVGCRFRQLELAATLRRLAEHGVEDFYRGAIARQIADDMRRHAGLISEQDLASCGPPIERAPICTTYRGFRILTVPPPGGGLQLLSALNILAELAPGGFGTGDDDWRKAVALTTSAVFRDRDLHPNGPADPARLLDRSALSDAYVLERSGEIAGGAKPVFAGGAAEEPGDTTHLSVCDRYGNIVLLTQSIQSVFGAKVAHRDLGFLYNNYLCTCPRRPHPYGLRGGCRPRSNVAPTLVVQERRGAGRPVLALGAAGSRRIISAILQVISGVIDHGLDVTAAVAAPRVHGLISRKVWIERPAASNALLAELRMQGREPIIKSAGNFAMGSVQALQFFADGSVRGAADPRRDGTAAVLP